MTILMALTVLCAPVAAGTLDDLLGSWEWVSASGGFAGGVYGPDDWGYTSQLVFAADGSVVEYRDEELYAQSTFELVGEGPGATLDAAPCDPPMMPFNDCGPYLLIFDDSGGETTMLLRTQLCADWYDFLYVARGPVAAEQRTWSGIKAVFR
jgi:hypothetical protein